jgi:hypothetical protein
MSGAFGTPRAAAALARTSVRDVRLQHAATPRSVQSCPARCSRCRPLHAAPEAVRCPRNASVSRDVTGTSTATPTTAADGGRERLVGSASCCRCFRADVGRTASTRLSRTAAARIKSVPGALVEADRCSRHAPSAATMHPSASVMFSHADTSKLRSRGQFRSSSSIPVDDGEP